MKVSCAILMLLMPATLTAQMDYTQVYYPEINRAELHIVEGNYQGALQSFKAAFNAVYFSPSIDLYNAAVCALHLGEMATAKSQLIRIRGRGITSDYLWNRLHLFHEQLAPEWEAIKAYPRVRTYEYEEYRQELYEMEDVDQSFRNREGGYQEYGDTIAAIDRKNMERFRTLVGQYGFPGEALFGAENQILTSMFPGHIILHHYCQGISQGKYEKGDLLDILKTAVKNGRIEPNLMAELVALQNNEELPLAGGGIWIFEAGEKNSGYVVEKYPEDQAEIINKNRLQYGLDVLSNYHKKAAFSINRAMKKGFNFLKYNKVNQFPLDKATYDRIIINFEPLR